MHAIPLWSIRKVWGSIRRRERGVLTLRPRPRRLQAARRAPTAAAVTANITAPMYWAPASRKTEASS
ncbi:hypothetical protein ACFQ2B_01780 [Streptomyces stramineus]